MSDESMDKKHWSFWVVCIAGLAWNVGGAANYLMQTNMEFVNSMPATHQAIIIGRPAWATSGFAVGVFGGALGGYCLRANVVQCFPSIDQAVLREALAARIPEPDVWAPVWGGESVVYVLLLLWLRSGQCGPRLLNSHITMQSSRLARTPAADCGRYA